MINNELSGKKNKILTILGYILVAAALFYLAGFFMDLDFTKYSITDNPVLVPFIIISSLIYGGFLLLVIGISLMLSINMLSEKKIGFASSLVISGNTNIAKYIPGNIFHFVGRNILGKRLGLGHLEVALSTLLESVCMVISSILLVLIMAGLNLIKVPKEVLEKADFRWIILITGIAALTGLAGLFILYRLKRDRIKRLIILVRKTGIRGYLWYMIKEGFLFSGFFILQGFIFYIALGLIYPSSVSDPGIIFPVLGISILGWLLGYIVPGAPGGLGIRESVVVFALSIYADKGALLLAAFLTRIIFVIGDLAAFLIANLIKRAAKPHIIIGNGNKNDTKEAG